MVDGTTRAYSLNPWWSEQHTFASPLSPDDLSIATDAEIVVTHARLPADEHSPNAAYQGLGALGLNYTAVDQDASVTGARAERGSPEVTSARGADWGQVSRS